MIYGQLTKELKDAIRSKNDKIKNYVRGIKTKITEYCIENGADRNNPEDEIAIEIIIGHKKSLEKAIELLGEGEQAKNLVNEYKEEIVFCNGFLPSEEDAEKEIEKLVKDAIIELNANNEKDIGKVIGNVMKKKKFDGTVVKKIATKILKVE